MKSKVTVDEYNEAKYSMETEIRQCIQAKIDEFVNKTGCSVGRIEMVFPTYNKLTNVNCITKTEDWH